MNNMAPTREMIERGMKVVIIEKHNQRSGEESVGVVEDILTSSPSHPHGIKVRLSDGRVGRVQRLLENSNLSNPSSDNRQ